MAARAEVLDLLADVLDYPRADLAAKAIALAGLLREDDPEGANDLASFGRQASAQPLSQMEEAYIRSFDMNPGCPLYVGYHLYGETYKRGAMMSELQGAYARHGLASVAELPDHLCQILRWLAREGDDPQRLGVLQAHVVPAVQKVARDHARNAGPYGSLIRAAARAVEQSAAPEGLRR